MASITLTFTADQAKRIAAAYNVSTTEEFKTTLIQQIKDTVRGYETMQVQRTEDAKIDQAKTDAAIAIEAALESMSNVDIV